VSWYDDQLELYLGSGSGTLAEQAQRGQNPYMPTAFQNQFFGGQSPSVSLPGFDFEPLSELFDIYQSAPNPNLYSTIQSGIGLIQGLVQASQQPGIPQGTPGFGGVPDLIDMNRAMSINANTACWSTEMVDACGRPLTTQGMKRRLMRRRARYVRMPNGTISIVSTCAPRRMNPLNPRALGRAARRLGSFQRMASHVEKVIARACKTKSRSRSYARRPSWGGSCAPRGCA
jgi:hypothetical protein